MSLWNSIGVNFALSLGDLIDGQNSGTYGQGNLLKYVLLSPRVPKFWPYQTPTYTEVYRVHITKNLTTNAILIASRAPHNRAEFQGTTD